MQDLDDADSVLRKHLANCPKNLQWFAQLGGQSRLTYDGDQWRFRAGLSQPSFNRYGHDRGDAISARQARRMAGLLATDTKVPLLDEDAIHDSILSTFTEMFLDVELDRIPMAHASQPAPSTESRRLPVTRWLDRTMRPSFLVWMCSNSPATSCS